MKKGGGGGDKPLKAGSAFEEETLATLIGSFNANGFDVVTIENGKQSPRSILLENKDKSEVELFFKAAVHSNFFEPKGIYSKDFFSARLEPDTAIYSSKSNTLTIIEKKQQTGAGSLAEKLQTCDYKMYYYKTLCKPLNIEIDLIWQLGPYFIEQESNLKSVFEYMLSKGSRYFFLEIPFSELRI